MTDDSLWVELLKKVGECGELEICGVMSYSGAVRMDVFGVIIIDEWKRD